MDQQPHWVARGLALLAFTAPCWSGAWGPWLQALPLGLRSMFITVVPGLGLLARALGAATLLPEGLNVVVGLSGLLAGLTGFALPTSES